MSIWETLFKAISDPITGIWKRRRDRHDKVEDTRVAAYREILDAVGTLRAAGEELRQGFDYNQEPAHAEFAPTNDAIAAVKRLAERRRGDVGGAFSDSAKSIAEYWNHATELMWNRDYGSDVPLPTLEQREIALHAAVPLRLRDRVAPGYYEDPANQEALKQLAASGQPPASLPPGGAPSSPKQLALPSSTQTSAPTDAIAQLKRELAPQPALARPRVYIDATVEEIESETSARASRLYVGKWLRTELVLSDAYDDDDGRVRAHFLDRGFPYVVAFFDAPVGVKLLSKYKKGDVIKLVGVVSEVSRGNLTLDPAEIEDE